MGLQGRPQQHHAREAIRARSARDSYFSTAEQRAAGSHVGRSGRLGLYGARPIHPKFIALCPVADGNCFHAKKLTGMEYRGTEYHVVQTSHPTGWKWTVHAIGRRVRTGSAINRVVAIALAQRAIDKLLKSDARQANTSSIEV